MGQLGGLLQVVVDGGAAAGGAGAGAGAGAGVPAVITNPVVTAPGRQTSTKISPFHHYKLFPNYQIRCHFYIDNYSYPKKLTL